jgi:hypothetical protein
MSIEYLNRITSLATNPFFKTHLQDNRARLEEIAQEITTDINPIIGMRMAQQMFELFNEDQGGAFFLPGIYFGDVNLYAMTGVLKPSHDIVFCHSYDPEYKEGSEEIRQKNTDWWNRNFNVTWAYDLSHVSESFRKKFEAENKKIFLGLDVCSLTDLKSVLGTYKPFENAEVCGYVLLSARGRAKAGSEVSEEPEKWKSFFTHPAGPQIWQKFRNFSADLFGQPHDPINAIHFPRRGKKSTGNGSWQVFFNTNVPEQFIQNMAEVEIPAEFIGENNPIIVDTEPIRRFALINN